ncbi:MAG TPA: efflux RND transporter periplasmic adaptor subunit [Anaerolineales bacterium]|nr:efflux RND transporter periplasmic adaptor subunit [Anaerolineales bacterium]
MKNLLKAMYLFLIVSLSISLAGCEVLQTDKTTALEASGIIEARQVAIAAELSGRVNDVFVTEGQAVEAGEALFTLDDSLLQVQRQDANATLEIARSSVQAAQASLDYARAQYELTLASARAEALPRQEQAWLQEQPDVFDLPAWYFTQEEQLEAARVEMENCQQDLKEAEGKLGDVKSLVGGERLLQAENHLAQAQDSYQIAELLLERSEQANDNQQLEEAAQKAFDDASRALEEAQEAYNEALTSTGAQDLLEARARYMVARACLDTATNRLHGLQFGEHALTVRVAEKAVAQAEAMLQQAQTAVDQAQANLALVETQAGKLQVNAPIAGVVLTRSLEPGEVLQAGLPALTIAQLEKLTVTVYVSEERYGQLKLGDSALLRVDSYPGESFEAHINRIADKAEYTPRNVQTKEERQTTVYAIDLTVDNVDGKLKPGMPVDVEFQEKG